MRSSLLTLLLFITLSNCVPTFPNIGYLGIGYDVIFGNPHFSSNSAGIDPGFRQYVYNLSEYSGNMTPDRMYLLPYGVQAQLCSACELSFQDNQFQSTFDYQQSLAVDVSVDLHAWGVAFSASVDYQNVQNQIEQQDQVIISSYASCSVYCAQLQTYKPPPLHENFMDGVASLPAEYNSTDYFQFISSFGTHFVTTMNSGGRFGQRSSFDKSSLQTLENSGIKISEAAGYSVLLSAGAVNVMTQEQISEGQQYVSSSYSQSILTVGSRIPPNGNALSWAANATLSPMPLSYSLLPITSLLTSSNFPEDKIISQKQANLQQALADYCPTLASQGHTCTTPAIPANNTYVTIYNNTCGGLSEEETDPTNYVAKFLGNGCSSQCEGSTGQCVLQPEYPYGFSAKFIWNILGCDFVVDTCATEKTWNKVCSQLETASNTGIWETEVFQSWWYGMQLVNSTCNGVSVSDLGSCMFCAASAMLGCNSF